MACPRFVGRTRVCRYALDPGRGGETSGAEPACADVRKLLGRHSGAVRAGEQPADAVDERRRLCDAVTNLRRRDLGAVRRLVSRVRHAVSSSDEEANGSQHEYEDDRSELTKSRAHREAPSILHLFERDALASRSLQWRFV